MTAKEMFEELGYTLAPEWEYNADLILAYIDYEKCILIKFYLKKKEFCKERIGIVCSSMNTGISELQAINKQFEELGWI